MRDIVILTATITVCMMLLDMYTPGIGAYARQGAGFGLGIRQVGGMDDPVAQQYYANNMTPPVTLDIAQQNSIYDTLIASRLDTTEGMDDPIAQYYYTHNNAAPPAGTEGIAPGHPIYDTLVATRLDAPQVNIMERFMDDARRQHGGATTESVVTSAQIVTNANASPSPRVPEGIVSLAVNSTGDATGQQSGQTPGERGLVFGILDDGLTKEQDILYSSALVDLSVVKPDATGGKRKLMLDTHGKYVQLEDLQELPMSNNQMFKLRLVLAKKQPNGATLRPIRYGDAVYLAFNDAQSNTTLLNHNGDLNALKSTDTKFMLFKKSNMLYRGAVNMQDQIVIGTNVDTYLKAAGNNRINTGSSLSDASIFKISAQKGCGPLWRYSL